MNTPPVLVTRERRAAPASGRPSRSFSTGTMIAAAVLGLISLQPGPALADPVDQETARRAAATFLSRAYPATVHAPARTVTPAGRSRLGIKKVEAIGDAGRTLGFAVSLEPAGYLLLAGDDDAPAIKLHSERGSIGNLPPVLLRLLHREMAEDLSVLADLKRRNAAPDRRHKNQWSALVNADAAGGALEFLPAADSGVALLTTTWGQTTPYNDLCPQFSGTRMPAGCNAIALAQILRYWRYPIAVSGDSTYADNMGSATGTHSIRTAGLDAYDWDNMADAIDATSPEAERQAVSKLVYQAAVALGSDFELTTTTAGADQHPTVLSNSFDYVTDGFLWRSAYSTAQWFNRIIIEIGASRPISYGIWDDTPSNPAGHVVVCDGYRNGNEIHLNFGWSGASDAWYNLDTVNGGGRSWTRHGATFGIVPRYRTLHVNSAYTGTDADGTPARPFATISRAYNSTNRPLTLRISGAVYPETLTFARPMHIQAYTGPVTIGR